MLRRAEKLTAVRAHELGIVDALAVDPRTLFEMAAARVRALAGGRHAIAGGAVDIPSLGVAEPSAPDGMALSPTVIGFIEEAVREAAAAPTLEAALEAGYRAFGKSACTAAAREGIRAFGERRRPDFTATG
jgi:enoyl-CoA hydratase/3-hydroxyacyl-CoA dehydrogenase